MSPVMIRLFSLVAIALAAAAMQAKARAYHQFTEADARQVQAVVGAQLDAFAANDAARAFETATPQVRQAMGSPDRFLAMVRTAYPMVYRPASVNFLPPEQEYGQVLQLVEIKDSQERSWLALFALERQRDRSWRISGCLVAENRSLQV